MAEPRLGPDELDRLEDALEGLEALDDLRDPSEAVSTRLADFQFILQASREALPLVEVRPGILDGVLSEARMSATDRLTPAAEPPPANSFWSRVRKAWLVPSLAVAGSAALVLILVKPLAGGSPQLESTGAVASKQGPSPTQGQAAQSPAPTSDLANGSDSLSKTEAVAGQGSADGAPAPPAAAPETRAGVLEENEAQRDARQAAEPEVVSELDADPAPDDAEAKNNELAGPTAGWNAIELGDSAREGGDCFTARNHYARALDDGNDSVRARAYVGMGLCKRSDGSTAAAEEYFDKARELDEDAVKFADTRTEDEPAKPSSRKPAKKPSAKRKSAIEFDQARDSKKGL